jgi:alginate O-acetyltransferase complex protein AlgI
MSFVDVEFAFFFPAVLLLYWLLPRTRVAQNSFLLLASWVFYAGWNWKLLPLLLFGGVLDYLIGNYLGARPVSDPAQRRRRSTALAISLTWNLGALAFFKYVGFFAHSFNRLFEAAGLGATLPELQIILPLGISFYTLQRIGYIVDVYYERIAPSRSPLDFLLFTGFFPQLTAGPIARGAELLPQLAQPRRLQPGVLASAAATFLLGYMLKAWVADSIGSKIVDPVFGASADYSAGLHWLALFGYAMQVFADFAGYSLLAIGTARFFGIELPINFDSPFLARSLPEFWRRWHITLNRWLFDYIYNPLVSGSGWFRGRFYLTLVLVFLASGLWHGAALTFISWGLMHGIGMAVHRGWDEYLRRLCRKDRKYVTLRKSAGYAVAAWALTQLYFMLSLIPFHAFTLTEAVNFARDLFVAHGDRRLELGAIPKVNEILCVGFVILLHVLDMPAVRGTRERLLRVPAPIRGMAYGAVIVYLFLFVPVGASTFIYRQF